MNPEFKQEVGHIIKTKVENLGNRQPVVFYGSSSLRLWETLSEDFPEFDCLNLAFGGSTIKDCYEYYHLLLKKTNPKHIVFYAGDNDIGKGANAEETTERFKQLYSKIKADFKEVPFTFLSIKPSPQRAVYLAIIEEVNQKIKVFLESESKAEYLDIYSLMFSENQINASLFIEDELHMNEKGYELWKDTVRTYFGLEGQVINH